MDSSERVCPFCGQPPGAAMFCAACGRNLAAVTRLPTREQWQAQGPLGADGAAPGDTPSRPLDERCADATAGFLEAMRAAGDPGAIETPVASRSSLRRVPRVRGWVVRPVDRDDDRKPRRYTPGLVLAVDGTFHRLDSELRGWGQRDFPQYHHTVELEPMDLPVEEALIGELAAVLREHELGAVREAG